MNHVVQGYTFLCHTRAALFNADMGCRNTHTHTQRLISMMRMSQVWLKREELGEYFPKDKYHPGLIKVTDEICDQ
jgi:hypothetical protein